MLFAVESVPLIRSLLSTLFSFFHPVGLAKWACALALACAVWIWINHSEITQFFEVRDQVDLQREEMERRKTMQADLERERQQLTSGGFSMEKAIRERFLYARPGEKVIFIQTPLPDAPVLPTFTPPDLGEE